MYYFADEPEPECFECSQKDNLLGDIKYWLRAVLDQLYGLEEFKVEELEHYLDELTNYVGMKLPSVPLVVRKNRTVQAQVCEVKQLLNDWKDLNNQYLNSFYKAG